MMDEIDFQEPLRVRGARHTRISFDTVAPRDAMLVMEHLRGTKLLARECRPLSFGTSALDVKTPPKATHLACALLAGGTHMGSVRFHGENGPKIEATGRNFIVIGAMKAGTTSLFSSLAQHPALCRTWTHLPGISFSKEINYFQKLYRKGHTALNYDWRFPFEPGTHKWTLEVSPNYTKWPGSKSVPGRIAALNGHTRLAYIMRHPVDRIESHIAHRMRVDGQVTNMKHFIRTSSYAMQLDKYMGHFPRDRILLLDFDDLRREPAIVFSQLCEFLEIETFAGTSEIHNTREFDFRLDRSRREELARTLRPDILRLIGEYDFKPAERWLERL